MTERGGTKASATLGKFEKKKHCENKKKQTKFHKSEFEITNEDNMLTNQCWNPASNLYRYLG